MPNHRLNHHGLFERGSESSKMPGKPEEDKTYDFEKFIVHKFHRDAYRLLYWRKNKFTDRDYIVSRLAPDLIYEYRGHRKTVVFAVSCAWRGCYINGSVVWAGSRQIRSYYDFQFREGTDVFILIGIGNTPADPAELYIVPLNHIPVHKTTLHSGFLENYKRLSVDQILFLDDRSVVND